MEFQNLNNVIRLNGQVIKKIVTHIIPKELIKLIYSYYNVVPLDN